MQFCCNCCCDDNVKIVNPFYKNIDYNTLSIKLIYRDGINDAIIDIPDTDWHYSVYEDEIRVDLNNLDINPCCDCCPTDYKLFLEYEAGYDLLPECILDDFCNMLKHCVKTGMCDDCYDENLPVGIYLTSDKKGQISKTWNINKYDPNLKWQSLKYLIQLKNIASISLCPSINEFESWGNVVNAKC